MQPMGGDAGPLVGRADTHCQRRVGNRGTTPALHNSRPSASGSAAIQFLRQGASYLRKANGSQRELVAWLHVVCGSNLQPAVIFRIHKASIVIGRIAVIFKELSFNIPYLERVSGVAVSRFENVQDRPC